jgi:hypothetical protein
VFWADTTSRKNYVHFDTTYNMNQNDLKFAPFMGLNHHMHSIFFGAAVLADETIESYIWLFETFLQSMGGKASKLIIIDEDASMRAAIIAVFPNSIHRLCMFHIIKKLPEKIGPHLLEEDEFWQEVNHCVWSSETIEEFESRWKAILEKYNLENNEWLQGRYEIRKSWIHVFQRHLAWRYSSNNIRVRECEFIFQLFYMP